MGRSKGKPWFCSLDHCDKPGYARKLCKRHYIRLRKGLPMEPLPPKQCAFDPCDRDAKTRGLCLTHYMQSYLGKELKPIHQPKTFVTALGRICSKCGMNKEPNDFYRRPSGWLVSSKCKKCYIEDNTARVQAKKLALDG